MMTNREIRQFAWRQLKHNWCAAIASSLLSTLCLLLMLIGISCVGIITAVGAAMLFGSGFEAPLQLLPAVGIVIALLYILLLYLSTGFSLGMLRINLRIARGQKIRVREIFSGLTDFRHLWHFAWVYIFLNLGSVALHIPANVVSSIYGGGSSNARIMTFVCNVLAVVYALVMSMSALASADNPQRGAWQSMRISCHLMRCRKLKLVGLFLSFIPWFLLSVVTCGIAYLFMIPYLTVSEAIFFLSAYSEDYLQNQQDNVGGTETMDAPEEVYGGDAAEENASAERAVYESGTDTDKLTSADPEKNMTEQVSAESEKETAPHRSFDEVYREMLENRTGEKKSDAWENYERWKKKHPIAAPADESKTEGDAAPKTLSEEAEKANLSLEELTADCEESQESEEGEA